MSSGITATINVTVGGIPDDFTYQWSRNGANITGQTSSTLTLSNVSTTDIGVYTCTPRNSRGNGNSSSTTISVRSKNVHHVLIIILFSLSKLGHCWFHASTNI